jgi:hypothetical protein
VLDVGFFFSFARLSLVGVSRGLFSVRDNIT